MHEYDADTVPPGASPEPAPVEYAADDLQEIYEQGNPKPVWTSPS